MKILIPCFLLLFGACSDPEWKSAIATYKCDEMAFARVQEETNFCQEKTGYEGDFCLGTSIMRICKSPEQIAEEKKKAEEAAKAAQE